MAEISAIILAAGTSSRMGEKNKLFLDLDGKPIIQHVIEKVSQNPVDEIILVGSELSMGGLKHFEKSNIKLVENANYETGMTSSIKVGVRKAKSNHSLMICLGDMPLVKSTTYQQLEDHALSNPASIIIPTLEGKRGNPVIFPASLREEILNHEKPEGCKGVVQRNAHLVVEVGVEDAGILRDIDTREQYLDISS